MTVANYDKLNCPIAKTLSVLGDQWTLLIVRDALSGVRRFNEFQESLGISRNLLARRLAQLTEEGVLARVAIPGSKRHAYEPTAKCRDLRTVILAMAQWGEAWRPDPAGPRVQMLDKTTGAPVRVGFQRTKDGAPLESAEVKVIRHSQAASAEK